MNERVGCDSLGEVEGGGREVGYSVEHGACARLCRAGFECNAQQGVK